MDPVGTQPGPSWGGGQDQNFSSTQRKKKRSNIAWEKDQFFLEAQPFSKQVDPTEEDSFFVEEEFPAPEGNIPYEVGRLSLKGRKDIVTQHGSKPPKPSPPQGPMVQEPFAGSIGIEPSPSQNIQERSTVKLPGSRKDPRPLLLRLPEDHPLKVELAELRAERVKREPGWERLRKRFPDRFKGPNAVSELQHRAELQTASDREYRLLWLIDQLEKGQSVFNIGMRHEQLQAVIKYNGKPPTTTAPQKKATERKTSHGIRPHVPWRDPPIAKRRPAIIKGGRRANSNTNKSSSHRKEVRADGSAGGDEFIDIDSVDEGAGNREIEVIDFTGVDGDENDRI